VLGVDHVTISAHALDPMFDIQAQAYAHLAM
jgi:hypothetical protein